MGPSELMQDSKFMADFARATKGAITSRELRAKYGLSTDTLQSVIEAVAAERSSKDTARRSSKGRRKKRGPQLDAKASKNPTTPFADDSELVEDLARFAENILSEKEVRKRHRLDEKAWLAMAEDELLCERIDDRRIRRVRDGSTKRELAQKHVIRGPAVLAEIMDSPSTHAKHKIDSIRALDHLAAVPGQAAGADSSRFIISINIGGDVEVYNKSRAVKLDDPEDVSTKSTAIDIEDDTDNIDNIAILAAKQNRNDGGGQNHI
jgi:hypothetical protein